MSYKIGDTNYETDLPNLIKVTGAFDSVPFINLGVCDLECQVVQNILGLFAVNL